MKKLKIFILASIGLFAFNSCETTDLNLTDNPNALTPEQADIDFFLNDIQISFARTVNTFGTFGSETSRLSNMFGGGGNYQTAYSDVSFSGVWNSSYQRVMKDIRTMNPLAEEIELTKHIGVGQVIEAYLMMTLVDYFGDVPYSEAFDEFNLDPNVDDGASIYAAVLVLLDNAIANFNTESPGLAKDFYYDNNFTKWIKLANTLKMKVYIQTRLVDAGAIASFQQIVSSGNFITDNSDNFVFNFGVENVDPDSRHPGYAAAYQATGTSGYTSNWLMDLMLNDKDVVDPRIRYYFYRQRNSVPTNPAQQGELIRCAVEPIPAHYVAAGTIYCYPGYPTPADGFGYWGRDHGDRSGLPPDSRLKTARGLYPIGGRFDDNTFQGINGIFRGAFGQGIVPIVLSSTVDFWRAEAALFGGSGNPATHVANGVQKSFTHVRGFISRHADPDRPINETFIPPASDDVDYIAEVTARMNAATSDAQRLDLIAKEFFIALYGNGIDAFNFYRRTGAPRDIQPHLEPNPGGFIRSHFYPANEANNNANITQKPNVTQRVFWDTNPLDGFPVNN
jgi:hypothetical protein